MTQIEEPIPLLEEILGQWKNQLGNDYLAYRNHVYRMSYYGFALRDCTEEERRKIVVAACFHDLGIWSNDTVDYLPPSISLARDYLVQNHLQPWIPEIELMIDMHHKLRKYPAEPYPLVEVFRQADLADVSLGVIRSGLPRSLIKAVKARFPNAGFHKRLLKLARTWFSLHPFSPPPFMKW